MNDAISKLPKDSEIVGIQVGLAYVGGELEPNAVEAVGASMSKAGYPMHEIARLFALWTDAMWKGWNVHPQPPPNNGRLGGPRRRPRRR